MSVASANLQVMINAARKAARRLVRDFGEVENLQVSMKGAGDFVSNADRKSEDTIREALTHARPAYGWLGEETGEDPGRDGIHRWIVDPLDGTTNFLHGVPHWAVSIALERKGEITAGVVYDPVKDEMFTAEKGAGAWLNGRRLRVSGRREMSAMIFGCGAPWAGSPHLPRWLRELAAVLPQCAGVRRGGAAALDMAYVAAGRLDAYWERGVNPWDVAAGAVLVREAGGLLRDLDRDEGDPVVSGAMLAGNAEVAPRLLGALRGA
jgi:myo-inositol-1(or 4)-monophosphatase